MLPACGVVIMLGRLEAPCDQAETVTFYAATRASAQAITLDAKSSGVRDATKRAADDGSMKLCGPFSIMRTICAARLDASDESATRPR